MGKFKSHTKNPLPANVTVECLQSSYLRHLLSFIISQVGTTLQPTDFCLRGLGHSVFIQGYLVVVELEPQVCAVNSAQGNFCGARIFRPAPRTLSNGRSLFLGCYVSLLSAREMMILGFPTSSSGILYRGYVALAVVKKPWAASFAMLNSTSVSLLNIILS